jgi:multidrug efflux pump
LNFSALFINRPIGTVLLTLALALIGLIALQLLPVAPLPQVDFPAISVQANLAGASSEVMAATVATPLEKVLGQIAGVNEITSTSIQGTTNISLQFDLKRDINGAARDVQSAIQAARTLLPSGMTSNPTYKKVNPADSPIMVLAITSDTLSRAQMYDTASTLLAQKLAQVDGIGQVVIGGGALPAIRINVNSNLLNSHQLSLEDIRTAINNANSFSPLGIIENSNQRWQLATNDQLKTPSDYQQLIIRYQDNATLRLSDVAQVEQSVQDSHTFGASNGKPAVLLILYRQPNANIIATVDRVKTTLPALNKLIPAEMTLQITMDRTPTIRSALKEVEHTLAISIGLVILVVFLFLRNIRATFIPTLSIPISLLATLVAMYLFDFSLNNISLMALIVATGFVVDDSIVVVENINRHIEMGKTPYHAALVGTREVGFTILAISLSLVAVFIPILYMGGIIGRLFQEFALTLSAAVLISMVISLTTTPALAAKLLVSRTSQNKRKHISWLEHFYRRSLAWSLRHPILILMLLASIIALNINLYITVNKGFFPQQDTGRIIGRVQADQSISFEAMQAKLNYFARNVQKDPDVETVTAYMGFGSSNSAVMFISLKPRPERSISASDIVNRLRPKGSIPGASLFLIPVQDIRIGTHMSTANYQYTLQADSVELMRESEPKVKAALSALTQLSDVNSDQQNKGEQNYIKLNRDAISQLGLTLKDVDNTLNNAFAQRLISTIYNPLNQYRVVLETDNDSLLTPQSLDKLHIINAQGEPIALRRIATIEQQSIPLSISHQAGFIAATFSFNLAKGVSLEQGIKAIETAVEALALPNSVQGKFQGTAKVFNSSLSSQPLLILAAIIALYLILGILYESLLHPITILSTLPSTGVGALLALKLLDTELSIIALIGIFLLIGLVKKNAILMIDFALERQRRLGLTPTQAIFIACQIRFRPIIMTTLAALLGAVPLAMGIGDGAELRTPLGITIIGGLIVSQILTLYTTPVVYVALENLKDYFIKK